MRWLFGEPVPLVSQERSPLRARVLAGCLLGPVAWAVALGFTESAIGATGAVLGVIALYRSPAPLSWALWLAPLGLVVGELYRLSTLAEELLLSPRLAFPPALVALTFIFAHALARSGRLTRALERNRPRSGPALAVAAFAVLGAGASSLLAPARSSISWLDCPPEAICCHSAPLLGRATEGALAPSATELGCLAGLLAFAGLFHGLRRRAERGFLDLQAGVPAVIVAPHRARLGGGRLVRLDLAQGWRMLSDRESWKPEAPIHKGRGLKWMVEGTEIVVSLPEEGPAGYREASESRRAKVLAVGPRAAHLIRAQRAATLREVQGAALAVNVIFLAMAAVFF